MLSSLVRHQILRGQKVKLPLVQLSQHLISGSSVRLQEDWNALNKEYDAIIIGAGHNGLVAMMTARGGNIPNVPPEGFEMLLRESAYLQKAGLNTLVLERRHVIGGAAVTEEIIPGYKFSRCSYVLSLLRPIIVKDLELKKHGLKVHLRSDHAFTPLLEEPGPNGRPRSLLMSKDEEFTRQQIAQFSKKDAEAFHEFDEYLTRIAGAIGPLLDNPPIDLEASSRKSFKQKMQMVDIVKSLAQSGKLLGKDIPEFYKLLTAPMNKILDSWFESEPLKATLATDSVIGAFLTPDTPGSGYVLLHHVMGEVDGVKGAWGYAEGGMGAVSESIASSARSHGATILTEKPVSSVLVSPDNEACGVMLEDGTEIKSKMVLSNATPKITFLDLVPSELLPDDFVQEVRSFDFKSPVTKINVAVNKLPNFTAMPNNADNTPGPNHFGTIHLNCERTDLLNKAYDSAMLGELPELPMIEMCIPSSLDPTLAPEGCHVISLFTQYTPYELSGGRQWDQDTKDMYCDRVFDCIEAYAPGFKDSVVGRDILPPPELERIFGLTGGNIFHGAMSLDQLYFSRPLPSCGSYRTPIKGLYLCGSGSHPGGGVMGAPGRNAASVVKADMV